MAWPGLQKGQGRGRTGWTCRGCRRKAGEKSQEPGWGRERSAVATGATVLGTDVDDGREETAVTQAEGLDR